MEIEKDINSKHQSDVAFGEAHVIETIRREEEAKMREERDQVVQLCICLLCLCIIVFIISYIVNNLNLNALFIYIHYT